MGTPPSAACAGAVRPSAPGPDGTASPGLSFVSAHAAAFDAAYGPVAVGVKQLAADSMFTIAPPSLRSSTGAKARQRDSIAK